MPKQFDYTITDTVNDMVACDQMRAEVESSIPKGLEPDPLGIICTPTLVLFSFVDDLTPAEEVTLSGLVAAHTGVGILLPDTLDNLTVAALPATGSPGDSVYVTDGVGGPGPAYFDGVDWRWYDDGSVVV